MIIVLALYLTIAVNRISPPKEVVARLLGFEIAAEAILFVGSAVVMGLGVLFYGHLRHLVVVGLGCQRAAIRARKNKRKDLEEQCTTVANRRSGTHTALQMQTRKGSVAACNELRSQVEMWDERLRELEPYKIEADTQCTQPAISKGLAQLRDFAWGVLHVGRLDKGLTWLTVVVLPIGFVAYTWIRLSYVLGTPFPWIDARLWSIVPALLCAALYWRCMRLVDILHSMLVANRWVPNNEPYMPIEIDDKLIHGLEPVAVDSDDGPRSV